MVSPVLQFLLQQLLLKFPFVFKMFSIESASKAGQFRSTYQILDYFYVFLKCMSKVGQFKSTYQILGCSLFFICLIPLLFVSFHSIKSTLKRSLDIYDLPHGPLLNLVVSIKPYYDSITQWTKTCNYLSFWLKFVLIACNFSPLELFPFRTFHSNNNHAQPSKTNKNPRTS